MYDLDYLRRKAREYGIYTISSVELVDSSHGEDDLRHNYVLDKKYVLRIHSALVMTEERILELSRLIKRFREFGLKAPLFIPNKKGDFLMNAEDGYCYLSEYLDLPLAKDCLESNQKELIEQRLLLISTFAQKYRNVDLSDTRSMYSLFTLSPYDQLEGVDEKESNLKELTEALESLGEIDLACELRKNNAVLRKELKMIHDSLPCCVFQGDENFSNLCIDEKGKICGLFDFNMAGTEVIANYLANTAFLGEFSLTEQVFKDYSSDELLEFILSSFYEATELIFKHYFFTEIERKAYFLYAKIALLFGYIHVGPLLKILNDEGLKKKATNLLSRMLDVQMEKRVHSF